MDCINTYGSYNRTCKGDYVGPFQPCKDVNANLTKTNISPLTAQVSRDTQEIVVKRNFYHVNLYIDSTGRVSNCRNSNLNSAIVKFRDTFKGSKLAGVAQCRIFLQLYVFMISIF